MDANNAARYPDRAIHPTAIIEEGVRLGPKTQVWDHVHIRHGAQIGSRCIIGEKSYIAYDVKIGDLVKMNAFVYVCAGVTIEDMVMVSAGTVFTNEQFPRAAIPERGALVTSEPTDETLNTVVRQGTTIGANATIGPGLELGMFCMVGMGAVVTKDVKPFQLVVGCPARGRGWVCVCGGLLGRSLSSRDGTCKECHRGYASCEGGLRLVDGPPRWGRPTDRKQGGVGAGRERSRDAARA